MSFTTDRNDPELGHGIDESPISQHKKYLILSEEERAKGFVRPVRHSYVHVGKPAPKYPLRDLTEDEKKRFSDPYDYVKFEHYPENERKSSAIGRYWTQQQLDEIGKGCGTCTTMPLPIAETYAREPGFYGATFCCGCSKHLDVNEFVWDGTNERVGS